MRLLKIIYIYICFYFPVVLRPNAGYDLLILEFSISQTTTHHSQSGRVISPSQRPLHDNTQHSQQTNIHAPGGIRTYNLISRAAADLSLRPRFENNYYEIIQPICESRLLNKALFLFITSRGLFSASKPNIRFVIGIMLHHEKCLWVINCG